MISLRDDNAQPDDDAQAASFTATPAQVEFWKEVFRNFLPPPSKKKGVPDENTNPESDESDP
jgi:hypothetical protein